MARRKSQVVLDLEAEVRSLSAYREAFFCLRAGAKPVELSSGEGEDRRTVELLGPARASGGVVINEGAVLYATDWLLAARHSGDCYIREVARLVERAQTEAIRGRVREAGIVSIPEDRRGA